MHAGRKVEGVWRTAGDPQGDLEGSCVSVCSQGLEGCRKNSPQGPPSRQAGVPVHGCACIIVRV